MNNGANTAFGIVATLIALFGAVLCVGAFSGIVDAATTKIAVQGTINTGLVADREFTLVLSGIVGIVGAMLISAGLIIGAICSRS
jgi:cell division protein FtsX